MSNTASVDLEVSDSAQFTSSCTVPGVGQVVLVPYPAGIMNLSPQMMQHHLTQNYFSGQSRTVYYKSNLSCLPTQPPPATNHAVEANNSRIQAMESTIKHLRVLLQNEIKSKKRESDMFDSVKAELEELKEQKLVLEKKLALVHEEANKEIILKCDEVKKEADSQLRFITEELREKEEQLDQLHKENEKLRQELEGAAKDNTHFVSLNQQLRAKVEDLQKQMEQLEILKSSLENSLFQEKATVSANEKQSIERESKLRMDSETLKSELDHIRTLKENGEKLFKDLAKKHAFMIEYAGEQMYQEYSCEHNEFLGKLAAICKASNSSSGQDLKGILKTAECIQQQLALINECRITFKENVQRVMKQIESGIALVSDLNFRAPSPTFEFPIGQFENMLEVLTLMGAK